MYLVLGAKSRQHSNSGMACDRLSTRSGGTAIQQKERAGQSSEMVH